MNIVILLGAPGSGKGTVAGKLAAENANLKHVSSGDLLRGAVAKGTEAGRQAKAFMEAGKLVPDALIATMIKDVVAETTGDVTMLLDGFPRNLSQAKLLEDLMEELQMPFTGVLSLEVPREELIARLINRGKVSGRSDDKEDVIIERLKEYESKTLPVAEYFTKKGNFHPVKGVGSLDEIFDRLVAEIEKHRK